MNSFKSLKPKPRHSWNWAKDTLSVEVAPQTLPATKMILNPVDALFLPSWRRHRRLGTNRPNPQTAFEPESSQNAIIVCDRGAYVFV
jgi:hypothetical protein